MAKRDRLWGAERIRGELLKLGIKVSKRTIQKNMRGVRTNHGGQSWATFLANHADAPWACDFIQATVSNRTVTFKISPRRCSTGWPGGSTE